ncbi:MAG: DUF4040 domain-containing protein [Anaerolineae bacterium]|nr:DUF4040 domain-containing protein [Anaerolineae bacterium]
MPFIVLSGLIAAPFAPLVVRAAKTRAGWVIALLPALIVAYLAAQLPLVLTGQVIEAEWPWVPSLDLTLAFRLDGLGLLFALLISGIGTLIAIYGGSYLKGHPDLGRFFLYLLVFMAAMLGVVLSDNLLALFVFWEMTSISSYLLIGFNHDQEASRKGALKALLITGLGGLFMLAGFVLLGEMGGSYTISQLPTTLSTMPLYLPMLILVLIGAFTKSAQWPFHIWLPDAMQAPTPVSAYLHSATMVKAGVFLLARLSPVLADTPAWLYLVSGFGLITMVAGGILALKQSDLKAILAYTTIGWLGTLVMLLGWGGHYAVEAAMVGVLTHALYKGALFMLAGGIDHETGTRDIHLLGGLRRLMPVSAVLTAAAALSMAGIPLLLGFVAKELLLEAALHTGYPDWLGWLAVVAVVLASLLNVAIALRLSYGVFFGPERYPKREGYKLHDPYPAMLLGPAVLVVLSLLFGVWPGGLNGMIAQASGAVLGESLTVKLSLWHGINLALILSLTAIALGVGVYLVYGRVANGVNRVLRPTFNNAYEMTLAGMLSGAGRLTGKIQHGYLRYYLMVILVVGAAAVGQAMIRYAGTLFSRPDLGNIQAYEIMIGVLTITAIVMIARTDDRYTAIVLLGVVGALISLIFVLFSAPDLALTQLLIETLMVIVFLLVFHFLLRDFPDHTSTFDRKRDLLISLVVGAAAFGLVLLAINIPGDPTITDYFVANSYTEANGLNIVNVILVDFRSLDTLGEISVLAIAGVGIYALLRGK